MNNVSRSTLGLYLVGWNVKAQLMQDCVVLITPLVLGLSSSCVTVHLQENNVSWFQHHSTRAAVIISFLSMSFKYILSACFIECFREMLLSITTKSLMHTMCLFVLWGNGGLSGTLGGTQIKGNVGCSP